MVGEGGFLRSLLAGGDAQIQRRAGQAGRIENVGQAEDAGDRGNNEGGHVTGSLEWEFANPAAA